MPDARVQAITLWLQQFDEVAGAALTRASADASFRRYFRASKDGKSWIVMDAPPGKEDSEPFVRIARYLKLMNLNAPRVIEADLAQGFLLLTDLGSTQYLVALKQDAQSANTLYADAIAALVRLQSEGASFQSDLPAYDEKLLRVELSLFSDWLCETHLGLAFNNDEQQQWSSVCELLIHNALDQPCVFVHRDFHSRNLMRVSDFNPGILDFQDAVCGPYTYDLVSLLKDCYISWPPDQVTEWALSFYRQRQPALGPGIDEELFLRHFHLMGVQRQLKAAGIFARLNHRDGKPGYMLDIPLTLNYIVAIANQYEELSFLSALLSERVLPNLAEATQ
jgi:aminoglycoside/choline kinase family phosphotransferase